MKPIYLIRAVCPKGDDFIYEARIDECDRGAVVKDIADGQYTVGAITCVYEIDMDRGLCRDVSVDIAGDVAAKSYRDERELQGEALSFVSNFGFSSYSTHFEEEKPRRIYAGRYGRHASRQTATQ